MYRVLPLFPRTLRLLALVCVSCTLTASESRSFGVRSAQPDAGKEYKVKAAFLYNFAKLTTWPNNAFNGAKAPLVIGVVGKDPFGPMLDKILRNKTIGKRLIKVKRYATVAGVKKSHILFVGDLDRAELRKLMGKLAGKPVLLVGEQNGFITAGGIVRFYIEKKRVRFEVNPDRAKKSGLRLSSQLLKLARITKK